MYKSRPKEQREEVVEGSVEGSADKQCIDVNECETQYLCGNWTHQPNIDGLDSVDFEVECLKIEAVLCKFILQLGLGF